MYLHLGLVLERHLSILYTNVRYLIGRAEGRGIQRTLTNEAREKSNQFWVGWSEK